MKYGQVEGSVAANEYRTTTKHKEAQCVCPEAAQERAGNQNWTGEPTGLRAPETCTITDHSGSFLNMHKALPNVA